MMNHKPLGPRPARIGGLLAATLLVLATVHCAPSLLPMPSDPVSTEDARTRAATHAGSTARGAAQRRLERYRFEQARKQDTLYGWKRFLRYHGQGLFAERARARLAELRFRAAQRSGSEVAYQRFLRQHGTHPQAARAWRRLLQTQAKRLTRSGTRAEIAAFLARHPKSDAVAPLRRRLEALDYKTLGPASTAVQLEVFLHRHPDSVHRRVVERRLGARLARRVLAFGSLTDVETRLHRDPAGPQASALRARAERLRIRSAVLALDPAGVRISGDPRSPVSRRHRALRAWMRRGHGLRARWTSLVRAAAPFRPTARLSALVAATRGTDPATAALALASLRYLPNLRAFHAILRDVAAPEPGVALDALDALSGWARAPALRSARGELLRDQLARERSGKDVGSRVRALVLAWAVGDAKLLYKLLAERRWHRPWALLPRHLRLLAWPRGQAVPAAAGQAVLRAYRSEAHRLIQMVPQRLDGRSRHRAEGAAYELMRLAIGAETLLARHGIQGRWQRKLRAVADRCRARALRLQKQLRLRFSDYVVPTPGATSDKARAHERQRPRFAADLALLLRRLRAPKQVVNVLCDAGISLAGRCSAP